MITMEMLRERIIATNTWKDIADVLEFNISPEALAAEVSTKSENDWIVWKAFVDGSISSNRLRDKLHRHPFPDITRLGVYSDDSLEYHVGGGLANAIQITSKADKHGHPFESASKVLDFGCGTSRILRYMVEFMPGPQYYGSEVFSENIKWGRSAFPEVTYIQHGNYPPLEIRDCAFDIIYAYSIFTHYEEKLHLQWLSELERLLKPEGLLILTVHGKKILDRCKDEQYIRRTMCIEGRDYEELCNKFNDYGYVFYRCYDPKHLERGGLNAGVFGITYISKEYIRKNWSNKFHVLEHDEGAVSNWHDYVIMKKS
ncbi:MAG: class I SAM-dependent methyltransferase [Candidatus Hodarchaeota archaeon]